MDCDEFGEVPMRVLLGAAGSAASSAASGDQVTEAAGVVIRSLKATL